MMRIAILNVSFRNGKLRPDVKFLEIEHRNRRGPALIDAPVRVSKLNMGRALEISSNKNTGDIVWNYPNWLRIITLGRNVRVSAT